MIWSLPVCACSVPPRLALIDCFLMPFDSLCRPFRLVFSQCFHPLLLP